MEILDEAGNALTDVSLFLSSVGKEDFKILALYATPYLELFGDVTVGWLLLWQAVIAQDKLNKIFELFYTTKGMEGSGLGLSMVQRFVESLGGRIAVESRVGAGSTFNMIFPKNDTA